MTRRGRLKVVIVGGGVAGLAAAHELRRREPSVSLLLLEARQLLGGRVLTQRDPLTGEPLELGAEFVHGRPPEFLALLRRARIRIAEDDNEDENDSDSQDSPFEILPRLLRPWLASGAPDLAIGPFLRRQKLPPHARQMLRRYVQSFYVAPLDASTRAIARMEVAAADIQGDRAAQFPAGYDAVVCALARSLRPSEIRLGTTATSVTWRSRNVSVRGVSVAGAEVGPFHADAVVLATPFLSLGMEHGTGRGALALRPAIASKRRAASSLRMGHATKVFLRFDDSVNVPAFFFGGGAVPVWWSAAAPDTHWLVGWAGGRAAVALDRQNDRAVLKAALRSIAGPLGRPPKHLARALTGFRCARWSREPFIQGAYAYVPLGADGAMAELARPVEGTLFFAGEATNPEHAGTVHGAHESGVRAARELLEN